MAGVPVSNGLTTEMVNAPAVKIPQIPQATASGTVVAPPVAPPPPPQPSYMPQLEQMTNMYRAPDTHIQQAAQGLLPAYQSRLGGLQGPTMNAMRLNAQQDIQSQYGNALRAAGQQAGTQGIRGPAAVAMQQDIRNQMGQAQAKYSRDLTIADWDAQRQAMADYYGNYYQQAGLGIGSLSALEQMRILQAAQQQQNTILR